MKIPKWITSQKKSLWFSKYLLSYLSIMIISFLISLVAYFLSIQMIREEIVHTNINYLTYVKNINDNLLRELDKIYIQIGFDDRCKMFLTLTDQVETLDVINMMRIVEDLRRFKLAHPIIKEVYFYSERSGIILNDVSIYRQDVFLEGVFPFSPELFYSWIDGGFSGMDLFTHSLAKGTRKPAAVYMRPYPIDRFNHYTGKLIIILDDKIINQIMSRFQWVPESTLFIIDQNDRIFLVEHELPELPGLKYSTFSSSENPFTYRDYLLTFVESDLYDWKYVSMIPRKVFFERAERIRNAIAMSMLVFLLTGLGISVFFARKYYTPLDKLVSFIQEQAKSLKGKDEDEFNFIQNVIDSALREKKQYLEDMNKQSRKFKNEFLIRLIQGEMDIKTIDEMKHIYGINIDNTRHYIVMLASLLTHDSSMCQDEESVDTAWLILLKTLGESLKGKFEHIFFKRESSFICLIDVGPEHSSNTVKNIFPFMAKVSDMLKKSFPYQFSAAVSNPHLGYRGISKAWNEAQQAMNYSLLTDNGSFMLYERLSTLDDQVSNYSFYKTIEQFSQAILVKDLGNAEILLDKLVCNWLKEKTLSTSLIRYRMDEVIHACVRSVNDVVTIYGYEFLEYAQMIDIFTECASIGTLHEQMKMIIRDLDTCIHKKESSEPSFTGKIIKEINENYHLSQLNISSIADILGVNVPYLSRLFKSSTGIGPLEYLQLVRIEHAKTLLKESDDCFKEIVKKVGFLNDVTFIRVFKRFEGITPGQYRKKEQ